MSLSELTRNSFQSGITATKWLNLCKLFISKQLAHAAHDDVQNELSNSVLMLFRNYPGDPALQRYLKAAIQDGLLPLSVFISTFLSGARSPELHNPATLDMLCRLALEIHYASGMAPIGSMVSYTESTIDVLGTVQDSMALLRTAHSLPMSHFHQLTNSASELLILLLSCVADVSQITTAQAMVHFAEASDMLQIMRLTPDVRQVLETFVLSLSLLLGDDAKAAREAQMMHTLQLALGKGDIIGPNSDTDIISCSLLLHSFLLRRAHEFGSGDGLHATSVLVSMIRWSSWTPTQFYTQLLLSAITAVSQVSSSKAALLWRGFVIGRLPHLLYRFEKAAELDGIVDSDWRAAMHAAVTSIYHHQDILQKCDSVVATDSGSNHTQHPSLIGQLLRQLLSVGLVEQSYVSTINPNHTNESYSRIQTEAQESGLDTEAYLEAKFITDSSSKDVANLLDRIWKDPCSHAACAEIIRKRFVAFMSSSDIESLSHLCRILYSNEYALDILSLHVKLPDILAMALALVQDYDCETVGDPQTAVSHLGDIVLFLQSTLARFHLSSEIFRVGDRTLSLDTLASAAVAYRIEDLSSEEMAAFRTWFKALFDSGSEGIEDTILRATRPKVLLRVTATLFSRAIQLCADRKMDRDVLNNGVSYFLGPLLNWTLAGVIKALLTEIQSKGFNAPIHQEVLQSLLLSPSCPRPILRLSAAAILRQFSQAKPTTNPHPESYDPNAIRKVAIQALGLSNEETPIPLSLNSHGADWISIPRQSIQEALAASRTGKAPVLDIDRCLLLTSPTKFLQTMWAEVAAATTLGEIEAPRRIATFILTMPRSPRSPPLMPIFMHIVVPTLVTALDHLNPTEQTMQVELLVAIISSALTAALHVEWALLSVCNEQRFVLGQSASAMARRLGGDLRKKSSSPTSAVIVQRLAASHSFVTNFPTFMSEL